MRDPILISSDHFGTPAPIMRSIDASGTYSDRSRSELCFSINNVLDTVTSIFCNSSMSCYMRAGYIQPQMSMPF